MVGKKSPETKKKWWDTMIARYGSEEAVKENMKRFGADGGKAETKAPKGFAARRDLAVYGGKKSRRTKQVK